MVRVVVAVVASVVILISTLCRRSGRGKTSRLHPCENTRIRMWRAHIGHRGAWYRRCGLIPLCGDRVEVGQRVVDVEVLNSS